MQAIQGNPHHRAQLTQTESAPQVTQSSSGKSPKGEAPARPTVDQVDLSPAARDFLETSGPGKSAQSPAHQARAMIAGNEALADMPFGQVVKAINHGTTDSLIAPQPAETDDVVDQPPADASTDAADAVVPEPEPAEGEVPAVADTDSDTPVAETDSAEDATASGADASVPAAQLDTDATLLDLMTEEEDDTATGLAG